MNAIEYSIQITNNKPTQLTNFCESMFILAKNKELNKPTMRFTKGGLYEIMISDLLPDFILTREDKHKYDFLYFDNGIKKKISMKTSNSFFHHNSEITKDIMLSNPQGGKNKNFGFDYLLLGSAKEKCLAICASEDIVNYRERSGQLIGNVFLNKLHFLTPLQLKLELLDNPALSTQVSKLKLDFLKNIIKITNDFLPRNIVKNDIRKNPLNDGISKLVEL